MERNRVKKSMTETKKECKKRHGRSEREKRERGGKWRGIRNVRRRERERDGKEESEEEYKRKKERKKERCDEDRGKERKS